MELESEICALAGSALSVMKGEKFLKGDFVSLKWKDLVIFASLFSKALESEFDVVPNSIRVDQTLEFFDKKVRPVIRLVAVGPIDFDANKASQIITSTAVQIKKTDPTQLDLIAHNSLLSLNAKALVTDFLRLNGAKQLDGPVRVTIDDQEIVTISGKLAPKPNGELSKIVSRQVEGFLDSLSHTGREIKIRNPDGKILATCKFKQSELRQLCNLLATRNSALFPIGPTLDAQGNAFEELKSSPTVSPEKPLPLFTQT